MLDAVYTPYNTFYMNQCSFFFLLCVVLRTTLAFHNPIEGKSLEGQEYAL